MREELKKVQEIKLLMTTSTIGGMWDFSLALCRALLPYPVEIHLVSLGKFPTENQKKAVSTIHNINFYPTKYKPEWLDGAQEDRERIEKKIACLCELIRPHILHCNTFINSSFTQVPKLSVYHGCRQTRWQAVKDNQPLKGWGQYAKLVQTALDTSDVVVFPTTAMQKAAKQHQRKIRKSVVIPNAKKTKVAANMPKEKIIFYSGEIWDRAKNFSFLCSAAAKLSWPVYVAGEKKHPATTKEAALENVRFLGKLSPEEFDYWVERTAIYINPSSTIRSGLI